MAKVYLIYSNSKLPLSPLIRWRTGSDFSHVGIILEPCEDSINSNSLVTHSALSVKGVRITTLKTFIAHASEFRITELEVGIDLEQFEIMQELSKWYEGTKYDLKGAVGLGIGEDWQEDDAFWCSEWVAFVLMYMEVNLPYLQDSHRITPKHCLNWPQRTLNINH